MFVNGGLRRILLGGNGDGRRWHILKDGLSSRTIGSKTYVLSPIFHFRYASETVAESAPGNVTTKQSG
jgi:hypothetical protein